MSDEKKVYLSNRQGPYEMPSFERTLLHPLSKGIYPTQGHLDCTLALFFNSDNAVKPYRSITVNNINVNSITELSPNHYLMSIIKPIPIEVRCPGYMLPSKTVSIVCMLCVGVGSSISLHGSVNLLSLNDICPCPVLV